VVELLNTLPGVGGTAVGVNVNTAGAVFPGSDFVPLPIFGTTPKGKGDFGGAFAGANSDGFELAPPIS
jgi:hypothetical protein